MKRRVAILCSLVGLAGWVPAVRAGSFEDFFNAIRQDDVSTLSQLAARGFDLNTTDPHGQPGLLLAIKTGSPKVADYLAGHPKTKVDLRNPQNETPLMLAVLKGQLQLAQKLVSRDADVNKEGWAPLHYAATATEGPVVEQLHWLLEQHAYIDAESPNGTTPLMMAAQYGQEETVRVLLQEGADATVRNQLGLTAIEFAQRAGRQHVVNLITAHVSAQAQAEKAAVKRMAESAERSASAQGSEASGSGIPGQAHVGVEPSETPDLLPKANAVSVPLPTAEVALQPLGMPASVAPLNKAPISSPALPVTGKW